MARLIAGFARPRLSVIPVLLATVFLLTISASPAKAGAVIDVTQVGPDVVFTLTGSLNLTGATFDQTYPVYNLGFISGGSNWYVATGDGSGISGYDLTSYAASFGTDPTFYNPPATSTGSNFFIWGNNGVDPRQVGVPEGYESGSALSAEMTFVGTIAGFGMTPGTYLYTIPNDTITLNIASSTTPVPEPATLFLLGSGLVAAVRRRRGQRA